jgi:gelsolin
MAAQAKLEDSNISNYGSKEHKDLKLAAAKTEKAWEGAGKVPGVQIWRIEKFHVVPRKDPAEFGRFYGGDSYIVLHTYNAVDIEGKKTEKLLYNVHFWLGAESSQDEMGTAAYKTVELDDLLGDLPVQYREVQGYESKEFLDLFKGQITILKGGVDSGFNKIKPEEYKPRLLHMKGQKQIRVTEVPLSWKSLNDGDVFLLDAGLELYQWNGKTAGINEKRKANEIIQDLKKHRNGKPKSIVLDNLEDHESFWKLLGGKPGPGEIAKATSDEIKVEKVKILTELSDKTGELKSTKVAEGVVKKSQLNTNEVFILDVGHSVFAWIGKGASKAERANGIKFATDYCARAGRPAHTPVVRVLEGAEPRAFLGELS